MPLHVSSTCAHHQEVKIALYSLWNHQTYRSDYTRGCIMQFWPPDDEHRCSKHVEAWNKLIVKQKFCASSWLITEINILRCTFSKTSKFRNVMLSCRFLHCSLSSKWNWVDHKFVKHVFVIKHFMLSVLRPVNKCASANRQNCDYSLFYDDIYISSANSLPATSHKIFRLSVKSNISAPSTLISLPNGKCQ